MNEKKSDQSDFISNLKCDIDPKDILDNLNEKYNELNEWYKRTYLQASSNIDKSGSISNKKKAKN